MENKWLMIIILWIHGGVELDAKSVKYFVESSFGWMEAGEEEVPDFLKIIYDGDLENNLEGVREIAKDDFEFEVKETLDKEFS
jgi:hypothetical protein